MTIDESGLIERADVEEHIPTEVAATTGRIGMLLSNHCRGCGAWLTNADVELHVAFHARIGDLPALPEDEVQA